MKNEKFKIIAFIVCCLSVLVFQFLNYRPGIAQDNNRKGRLVLIGIDAADWYYINPLLKKNKLPNFQSLLKNSSHGALSTVTRKPFGGAPMQWVSLATGKTYYKHKITGYYPHPPGINSKMRKSKAIWDILSEQNIKIGVAGWWATWPANEVNGYLVSNYTKYRAREVSNKQVTREKRLQLTYTGSIYKDKANNLRQTYPKDFYYRIEPIIEKKEDIEDKVIYSYFRDLNKPSQKFYDIKWNVVANEIFSDSGLLLLNKPDIDFVSVIMHGVDVAYHRSDKNTPDLLNDYYMYIDKKLGQWLSDINKNTTVMIVSEHGHKGKIGHIYKAIDGILIIKGPDIKENYSIEHASILDIAPTILYFFDLKIPKDMDGIVLTRIFKDGFIKNHPVKKVDTYEKAQNERSSFEIETKCPFDQAICDRLVALGYFNGDGSL